MKEENKENCNFQQNYNVFGLDDKPCCYLYHKYCEEIDNCYFKRCKRLQEENFALTQESQQKSQTICELEQENENLKKEVKQIGSDFIKKGDYARELEKENKELKEENANLKSLIWYIHCCGEVETIDCIITEYYESRQTQYEKGFWKKVCALKNVPYQSKYKAILEEIREMSKKSADVFDCTGCYDIYNKINEVLK